MNSEFTYLDDKIDRLGGGIEELEVLNTSNVYRIQIKSTQTYTFEIIKDNEVLLSSSSDYYWLNNAYATKDGKHIYITFCNQYGTGGNSYIYDVINNTITNTGLYGYTSAFVDVGQQPN